MVECGIVLLVKLEERVQQHKKNHGIANAIAPLKLMVDSFLARPFISIESLFMNMTVHIYIGVLVPPCNTGAQHTTGQY
jgi:hypothetical protein